MYACKSALEYNFLAINLNIWATSWENLLLPCANNKGADQPAHPCSLISTFVVCYLDNIILILAKSVISSIYLASVAAQAGLSLPWSQVPKTGFLVTRLIYSGESEVLYPTFSHRPLFPWTVHCSIFSQWTVYCSSFLGGHFRVPPVPMDRKWFYFSMNSSLHNLLPSTVCCCYFFPWTVQYLHFPCRQHIAPLFPGKAHWSWKLHCSIFPQG